MTRTCTSCGGSCAFSARCNAMFCDSPPGTVQRMSKTSSARGVWAAARALVFHKQFPQLLDATMPRGAGAGGGPTAAAPCGSMGNGAGSNEMLGHKFNYNWKQWICNVASCLERGAALPPSCERMVRVLHFYYALDHARMLALSSQLAKAVIELVYRRAEKDRLSERLGGPEINETTLMTVVRSACGHKRKDVEPLIVLIIQTLYQQVVSMTVNSTLPVASRPSLPAAAAAADPPHSPVSILASTSASPAAPAAHALAEPFDLFPPSSAVLDSLAAPSSYVGAGAGAETAAPPAVPATYADPLHLFPMDLLDTAAEVPTMHDATSAPNYRPDEIGGAALEESAPSSPTSSMGPDMYHDPLVAVMMQCQMGDTAAAVGTFREALGCVDQTAVGERARALGVTPWHYMWLRLGDKVLHREHQAEQAGHKASPPTRKLLAELDVVFAEIESEREYGELTAAAGRTLAADAARGNFAAIATQGLLLLGADADLGGAQAVAALAATHGDSKAQEVAGLRLVLRAMDTDPWMAPLLLVRLVQSRHAPLHGETVTAILDALRSRAARCSVAALHLGALLADETAHELGYALNATEAAGAFRDCLYGVDLPREIRLLCMRRAGRLAAFGLGGQGVDLGEADRVLSKGVEAGDTFCIAHLANVRIRQTRPDEAADLFQRLFACDEREVYISVHPDPTRVAWETYRIHVVESEEQHFLCHVRNGATQPSVMRRERACDYGELMVIEMHERGLPEPAPPAFQVFVDT